jgi:hypothetical protein
LVAINPQFLFSLVNSSVQTFSFMHTLGTTNNWYHTSLLIRNVSRVAHGTVWFSRGRN